MGGTSRSTRNSPFRGTGKQYAKNSLQLHKMVTESKQAIFIYFYEYHVIKDMTQVSMWVVSFLTSISIASISTSVTEEYCLS